MMLRFLVPGIWGSHKSHNTTGLEDLQNYLARNEKFQAVLYDSYLKKNDKKKMNGNIVSYFLDAIIYECKWTKQNKKYVSCYYKII